MHVDLPFDNLYLRIGAIALTVSLALGMLAWLTREYVRLYKSAKAVPDPWHALARLPIAVKASFGLAQLFAIFLLVIACMVAYVAVDEGFVSVDCNDEKIHVNYRILRASRDVSWSDISRIVLNKKKRNWRIDITTHDGSTYSSVTAPPKERAQFHKTYERIMSQANEHSNGRLRSIEAP